MRLEIEIVLAFVVAFVCWFWIHRLKQIGKPGFKTWPLIGATVDVLVNYHRIYDFILWNFQVLESMTIIIPLPMHNYVFTVDPANVEYILKMNFSNYPKGEVFHERFQPLLGNGIFNSDGDLWKIQRKTASFEFASKILRELSTRVFRDYAVKLAEITEGAQLAHKPVDMQDLFTRMTLDTICKVGFGVHLGVLSSELPSNKFATAFDKCNFILSYRFVDPLWKVKRYLKLGEEGVLPQYIEIVDHFTYNVIQQRRVQLQDMNHEHKEMKQDLLSRFMMLDERFSDKDLRDVVLNFVIAGRDTTAATLSYFVLMIASHPEAASKILQELVEFEQRHLHKSSKANDFLQSVNSFAELLTFNSLSELVYLHAAINETLRLFPAVPLNNKGVVSNDVLPDGTSVKAGDIMWYAPYCMGRTEALWGADAKEFRPERWQKNGTWDFNVSPFKFSAFQAGPRICLGKESAYLQMKMTAAILCRFFSFQLVPGQVFKYRVMATISLESGVKVMPSRSSLTTSLDKEAII